MKNALDAKSKQRFLRTLTTVIFVKIIKRAGTNVMQDRHPAQYCVKSVTKNSRNEKKKKIVLSKNFKFAKQILSFRALRPTDINSN